MKVSKRTEYGVRAIVQLARQWPQNFVQSKDLAKKEHLPTKFLESILLALRRGGFLESKIGREGGYKLARPPSEISVGDIIRRLEGRLANREGKMGDNLSLGEVAVFLLNERLTRATNEVLDAVTLEQLVEHVNKASNQQLEMYYI
ncbi:RrF2 family transcriptional regulator [Humisphaera borealis]|uniref:Rrf2 family transcriptional regulator n=1 Tax=Humisphaera borealis TaxID=2807512 RepID=A0A7M2WXD7_9BACT|nr:Rrf2 family transcriptional regulator [Humisphaera borealis]QOV90063.1 Rrf2 family transcriptional regulator [Humisphaera borealis]